MFSRRCARLEAKTDAPADLKAADCQVDRRQFRFGHDVASHDADADGLGEEIAQVAADVEADGCFRLILGRHARIGTVDKFQGQEAPVVFFSMATSSGEDLPRNLEFLFSRNRLNVAISRAQSLAVLVASPKLLEIRCNTIEQMRMVNALCRFVEKAVVP